MVCLPREGFDLPCDAWRAPPHSSLPNGEKQAPSNGRIVDDTLNERFDAELEGFELIPRYNTVLRRRRGIGWLLRWHHMVLWSIQAFLVERTMRITLALDDELLAKAQALTAMTEKSALVQEALRALIQRESARRLALLKILALGNQDVAAGKVKSVADVVARLSATPLTWNRWSVRWFSTACATRNPSLARCSGKTVHRLAQLINDVPERFAELLLVVFSHDSDVA